MSSSKGGTSGINSSFDAFAKVDAVVSKPVLGSDGAASWQEFRKDVKDGSQHRPSAAPKAPLKKTDRLGTGFSSWEEERAHEDRVRREAGHAGTGSGYTTFKKKNTAEEAAERKRVKFIESRTRPDDKDYFLPAQTFQGWKFDYVFTTRPDRGTGYFWDGTDSIKKLRGELPETAEKSDAQKSSSRRKEAPSNQPDGEKKPKKKKRKKNLGPTIVTDPNNPMEQVAAIIQKRNIQNSGMMGSGPSVPTGWEATRDPSSGKTYYFNRATGERTWNKPTTATATANDAVGPGSSELPSGWQSAVDKSSGKTYYFHSSGETRWEKPTT